MSEIPVRAVSKGRVIEDPAKTLRVGSELFFKPTPVVGDVPPGAATLKNWDFFQGMLVHIAFTDGEFHRIEGSGVMVAPGIALCASHVFADHLESLGAGESVATCFGISSNALMIWHVRKVSQVPETDITILGVELASDLPPDNTFVQSIITTRTPAVGEELTICGFRAGATPFRRGQMGVEASGDIWVCRGKIVETYPTGRDRGMIPWPALAVEVLALGGMSGGPVYDRQGLLVGLLCSSIECEIGQGISYVSLLWPALTSRFEATWPSGIHGAPKSLLEIDRRLCSIDRPDVVIGRYDPSGSVHTEYLVWE